MNESFVSKIRDYAVSQPRSTPFPPASEKDIEEAEARLKFSIPALLKSVYLHVGNGGFGPGRGGTIIGLRGGYASDFGRLVETYKQLKGDQESVGKVWKPSLLPFCEWGCNIFSCVDCTESHYPIYLFEDFDVLPKNYTLEYFFRMWIEGMDILSYEATSSDTAEVVNPFTGEKARVTKRRKK